MVERQFNSGVTQALEEALRIARLGTMEACAIVMAECPPTAEAEMAPLWAHFSANARLYVPMQSYVQQMAERITDVIANGTMPKRGKTKADEACYNAAAGALSFDFANWIIEREMTRITAGAPGPLKVGFWFGNNNNMGLHDAYRRRMYHCVIKPMLALVGAVEDPSAIETGGVNEVYLAGDIVRRFNDGEFLPRFGAPQDALDRMAKYEGCVTITLREAVEWPHRNSNVGAWVAFANDIKNKGERVIFVRDTHHAYEPINGPFEDCLEASINLHDRMALYQLAKMNFFVPNGPNMLAIYSMANYRIMLKLQDDGHPFLSDTPSFWRTKHGVEPGGQFPWALHNQRIVWAPDTYEEISKAWEDKPYEPSAEEVRAAHEAIVKAQAALSPMMEAAE